MLCTVGSAAGDSFAVRNIGLSCDICDVNGDVRCILLHEVYDQIGLELQARHRCYLINFSGGGVRF
jgi:hypothetical protein